MDRLEQLIAEVSNKQKRNLFTFLTGAGVSSDSGIPTYRGSDGIWVKGTQFHKPEEFGTFRYFLQHPEEVWQYTLFRKGLFEQAGPNESHRLIVEAESILQDRFHLITQNIDGLHQRAGSKRVYTIHGTISEVKCSRDCKEILPLPEGVKTKALTEELSVEERALLKCPTCGAWLRPNILWFDEHYDERTHKRFSALNVAKNSGILFIAGTSGATGLPQAIAQQTLKYAGTIVDMNIEDNWFTEFIRGRKNGLVLRGTTAQLLPQIIEWIRKYNT